MTRTLVDTQILKRVAIRTTKDEQPSTSVRLLAKMHDTTPRVVMNALARSTEEWHACLSAAIVQKYPSIIQPIIPLEPLVPRDYQASAARASVGRNTLLVLPTGLGKTIVALLHVEVVLGGGAVDAGDCRVWYGAGKAQTRRVAIVDTLVPQGNLTIMTDHIIAVASAVTPEIVIMPECHVPAIPYPVGYPAGDITRVYGPGGRRASMVQEKRLYSFEEHWAAQQALGR